MQSRFTWCFFNNGFKIFLHPASCPEFDNKRVMCAVSRLCCETADTCTVHLWVASTHILWSQRTTCKNDLKIPEFPCLTTMQCGHSRLPCYLLTPPVLVELIHAEGLRSSFLQHVSNGHGYLSQFLWYCEIETMTATYKGFSLKILRTLAGTGSKSGPPSVEPIERNPDFTRWTSMDVMGVDAKVLCNLKNTVPLYRDPKLGKILPFICNAWPLHLLIPELRLSLLRVDH